MFYDIHVVVDERDDAVVVDCELVACTVALNYLHLLQVYLDGLNTLVVDASGKNERVLFSVLLVGVYAMVHRCALLEEIGYAAKNTTGDCAVGYLNTEEAIATVDVVCVLLLFLLHVL